MTILLLMVPFRVFADEAVTYQLAWPGILPDSKLYTLKVVRNKILERMILDPVDKVRFDLLMADKTIYASKLLVDKGEIGLASTTALKGEDYYSQLVQQYNNALLQGEKIPQDLDKNITLAAQKHQEVFLYEKMKVGEDDEKVFVAANNFSHINYTFIEGLRNPKKNK